VADPSAEVLRRWSHLLLWASIVLPALGAVAVAARYYVERYERKLTSARSEAAVQAARDEAASARGEATRAQQQQEHIRAELDRSKEDLEALRVKSAPRRIAPAQQAKMLAALGHSLRGQPVAVAHKLTDGESLDFATDIGEALKKAGCNVADIIKTSLNDFPGYVVVTAHGNVPEPTLERLQSGLQAAGIPVRREEVRENSVGVWYPNVAHIIVGRKAP
jgi:hypothetical protein